MVLALGSFTGYTTYQGAGSGQAQSVPRMAAGRYRYA
jgi:hypothetical protein